MKKAIRKILTRWVTAVIRKDLVDQLSIQLAFHVIMKTPIRKILTRRVTVLIRKNLVEQLDLQFEFQVIMKKATRKILTRWVTVLIRKHLVEQLSIQLAFEDMLTGLPNRRAMIDGLRAARNNGIHGSIAYFDLDGFRFVINNKHGHAVGDEVLCRVGQRLRDRLPPGTLVSRFGGADFCIFLANTDMVAAVDLMERCLAHIRRPIGLSNGQTGSISMSVGIAPFAGLGIEDTFRPVDVALSAAKKRGGNCVAVCSEDAKGILAGRRELASAIITLQERNWNLQQESRTDPLTRLGNRLALDEVLDIKVGDRDLPHQDVAVAFIDVDHFGKYNRCYGDSGGDEALRRLGEAFQTSSRQKDMVFRKGGEEFVVVMPDVDLDAARAAAERMRAFIEGLEIPHADSATASVLTITLGVASGKAGMTVRDLMDAASKLATAAKNGGHRNQVHAEAIT